MFGRRYFKLSLFYGKYYIHIKADLPGENKNLLNKKETDAKSLKLKENESQKQQRTQQNMSLKLQCQSEGKSD